MDYENIYELLQKYKITPFEIDFFRVILNRLKETYNLNIIDFIVYGNFEKNTLNDHHQTIIQRLGLVTRHSANNGKNCGDLELTVEAMRTLYKNPNIEVYVIISSDRDIIPLLKAIKYENKSTFVLSTKNGFNRIVAKYADVHEYIEDIFGLAENDDSQPVGGERLNFGIVALDDEDIQNAKEVSRLFYNSKIWQESEKTGEAISLTGYIRIISKTIKRPPNEIIENFKLAHQLMFITIYQESKKGLCLSKGEKRAKLF